MKYITQITSLFLFTIFVAGCSSTLDTSSFTAEQKFDYAKKLYIEEDYFDALQEFNALVLEYPGSVIIDDASYYLAMTRFQRGEYILAAFEFSKLMKNMPASEFVPISQFMISECYYELSNCQFIEFSDNSKRAWARFTPEQRSLVVSERNKKRWSKVSPENRKAHMAHAAGFIKKGRKFSSEHRANMSKAQYKRQAQHKKGLK